MNQFVQAFEERLRVAFQRKAAEFDRYTDDEPKTAFVAAQIAGLYQDLVEALSH